MLAGFIACLALEESGAVTDQGVLRLSHRARDAARYRGDEVQPELVAEIRTPSRDDSRAGSLRQGPSVDAERLFTRLRPDLIRFACWLARDPSVAEDIVQESLARAWRARETLKEPSAIRAWLLTIVRREHARLCGRKRLELVSLDASQEESLPALEGPDGETYTLRQAILRLPLEYREPLLLQVLGGFSTMEIARELNLSSSAVLTRLFRARAKLRAICLADPVRQSSCEPRSTLAGVQSRG